MSQSQPGGAPVVPSATATTPSSQSGAINTAVVVGAQRSVFDVDSGQESVVMDQKPTMGGQSMVAAQPGSPQPAILHLKQQTVPTQYVPQQSARMMYQPVGPMQPQPLKLQTQAPYYQYGALPASQPTPAPPPPSQQQQPMIVQGYNGLPHYPHYASVHTLMPHSATPSQPITGHMPGVAVTSFPGTVSTSTTSTTRSSKRAEDTDEDYKDEGVPSSSSSSEDDDEESEEEIEEIPDDDETSTRKRSNKPKAASTKTKRRRTSAPSQSVAHGTESVGYSFPTSSDTTTTTRKGRPPKKGKDEGRGVGRPPGGAKASGGDLQASIPAIMFGFGDVESPLPETVDLIKSIAKEYIVGMTGLALSNTKKPKLRPEDIFFLIRHDKKKLDRARHLNTTRKSKRHELQQSKGDVLSLSRQMHKNLPQEFRLLDDDELEGSLP